MSINDLNSSIINRFVEEKLNHGQLRTDGPLSPKTVRDICTILKSIIAYAEREYGFTHIADNAVIPKKKKKELIILTKDEQNKLEQCIQEHYSDSKYVGIFVCLYTGVRLGEICALTWADVDFANQLLCIRHTLQRISLPQGNKKTKIIIDEPKSVSSYRKIPIAPVLVEWLKAIKGDCNDDDFILTGNRKIIEPRNYQYFFKRLLAGLEIRDVNFHILRHTFASRCVACGFDIKTLSEIMGHANTTITMEYYIHTSMEQKKYQMERLYL